MNFVNIALGRFWWTLEIKPSGARLVRWLKSGKQILSIDTTEGSLDDCYLYLSTHGSTLDGVLVADDSLPFRLLSKEEYYLIGTAGDEKYFLPGVPVSDLKIVESFSDDFVAVYASRVYDNFIYELREKGFLPVYVVPSAFLYAGLLPLDKKESGQIFIRINESFSEVWVYGNGVFLSCHRFLGGIEAIKSFLSSFYTSRYPLSTDYCVYSIAGCTSEVSAVLERPVTEITLAQDILKQLAEDAWLQGLEKSSLGRLQDSYWLRKSLKAASAFTIVSIFIVLILWAFVIGYRAYTKTDRLEFEKKIELSKEIALMSQKLEQDHFQLQSLLKQRTHHATTITVFVLGLSENMWLSKIEVQGNRVALQGYAAEEKDVSNYLSKLEKSPHLTRVRLRTTEKTTWKRYHVVRFDLIAEEAL